MIVVADTGPLRYLILIEHADVLSSLYGRVVVPPAVLRELSQERTPKLVRRWLSNRPAWLSVQAPREALEFSGSVLGAGEREAIVLAVELSAVLLMDDRDGRREAERRKLAVLGTLRVLSDAAEYEFVDLSLAFDRLRRTNFRASEQLMQRLLADDATRRGRT